MNTQLVYTFPDRKLFGEFDLIEFEELRTKIVRGEIKEELCLIDSNDRASCFDEYGILEYYSPEFICEKFDAALKNLLKAQMDKRLKERK